MFSEKYMFLVVLVIFNCGVLCDNDKNKNSDEIFVPTNDWKDIQEGQKVPAGLHYRVNLQTGRKEAKLINEKSSEKKSLVAIKATNEGSTEENTFPEFNSPEDLKEKLKKIKNDYSQKPEKDEIKTKFRTYEELKSDLNSLNLTPKTDSELLMELFKEYQNEANKKKIDDKKILSVLTDLIYLAHQFDNALEFVRLDGFKNIIYRNLNATNAAVRKETLKLFSSVVQNNSAVKIHALETGAIQTLLRLLSLDTSAQVKSHAITALSCLLRTFPFAQNNFIKNGGLIVFSDIFKTDSIKMQLKVATLLNDLLIERENDKSNFEKHTVVDLKGLLFNLNWCENLNGLLKKIVLQDTDDFDSIEKCLLAMQSIVSKCGDWFNKDVISNLQKKFKMLKENDEDEYFVNLYELCEVLVNSMSSQKFAKTEL